MNKIDHDDLIAHAKRLDQECSTWSSRKLRMTYSQPERVAEARRRENKMTEYIEVIAGGSGSNWTRHSLMKASLKQIRDAVDKLLRERKIPLGLERGLEREKDPDTGERDRTKILCGIAGPFTIYWRRATQQELDEFDYDTWLIFEFSLIEV